MALFSLLTGFHFNPSASVAAKVSSLRVRTESAIIKSCQLLLLMVQKSGKLTS